MFKPIEAGPREQHSACVAPLYLPKLARGTFLTDQNSKIHFELEKLERKEVRACELTDSEMARTRSNPSQPNDASQETCWEGNSLGAKGRLE